MMSMFQRIVFVVLLIAQTVLPTFGMATPMETFEGHLEIVRADNFVTGTSTTSFYLSTQTADSGRQTLALFFPDGLPDAPFRSGDHVTVRGVLSQDTIQVQSLQALTSSTGTDRFGSAQNEPIVAAAIEERRAVVIIVDMLDVVNSLSVNDVAGYMYTDSKNVDGLYEASSFQQLGFNPDTDNDIDSEPDVFGPYTINHHAADGCNYSAWASAADAKAQDDGIDLSIYQHKVYMLPSTVACGWSGLGSVGCSVNFCRVWVKDGAGPVMAHELGHNLGWYHASTDPENDGTLNSEYGDYSGIMGMPYWSQANAPHRDARQWFDAFPGTLQTTSTGGTFELYALELDPGVDTVNTQVVKIPKSDISGFYYVSYRRRTGDYPVRSSYADKINIHSYAGSGSNSVHITNLEQGETFTDSTGNTVTAITATDTGNDTAGVTIIVNTLPTASFSQSINGLSVQFTEACSDSDGTIQSRTWNFGDDTQSSGANPAHTYAAGGTYTVTLTVQDNQNGSATHTDTVTVTTSNTLDPPETGGGSSGGGSSGGGGCFIKSLL